MLGTARIAFDRFGPQLAHQRPRLLEPRRAQLGAEQRFHHIAEDIVAVRRAIVARLPPEADVLCTHPMFGPESGRLGWQGLPMVYERVRVANHERSERFLALFDADADKRQKDFLKRFMFLRIVRCFRLIKLMRLLRTSRIAKRWETRVAIDCAPRPRARALGRRSGNAPARARGEALTGAAVVRAARRLERRACAWGPAVRRGCAPERYNGVLFYACLRQGKWAPLAQVLLPRYVPRAGRETLLHGLMRTVRLCAEQPVADACEQRDRGIAAVVNEQHISKITIVKHTSKCCKDTASRSDRAAAVCRHSAIDFEPKVHVRFECSSRMQGVRFNVKTPLIQTVLTPLSRAVDTC